MQDGPLRQYPRFYHFKAEVYQPGRVGEFIFQALCHTSSAKK